MMTRYSSYYFSILIPVEPEIPGSHEGIMRSEVLADQLKVCINKAQESNSACQASRDSENSRLYVEREV